MLDDLLYFLFIAFVIALGVVLAGLLLYWIFVVIWYITYPTLAVATGGTLWWRASGKFSYERKRAEVILWLNQRWLEVKTWFKRR